MTTPLLEGEQLGRKLKDEWIWRDLGFVLAVGECGVLVGPSGSGKSLLLRVLCGLDRPDEGRVRFRGAVVGQHGTPAYRARVMYVQQQPVILPGTVETNLAFPLDFQVHAERTRASERADDLFERVGKPPGFRSERASVLSGGEGQLLGLVRALLLDPDVLLLDEPTAHLDPETTLRVEGVVRDWVEGGERAVLWTSHDPAQVERIKTGPLLALGERA